VRHCLELIAIELQNGNNNIQDVVQSCPKSKYTEAIELVNVEPIKLKAVAKPTIGGQMECEYNPNTGSVECEGPF